MAAKSSIAINNSLFFWHYFRWLCRTEYLNRETYRNIHLFPFFPLSLSPCNFRLRFFFNAMFGIWTTANISVVTFTKARTLYVYGNETRVRTDRFVVFTKYELLSQEPQHRTETHRLRISSRDSPGISIDAIPKDQLSNDISPRNQPTRSSHVRPTSFCRLCFRIVPIKSRHFLYRFIFFFFLNSKDIRSKRKWKKKINLKWKYILLLLWNLPNNSASIIIWSVRIFCHYRAFKDVVCKIFYR